MAKVKRNTTPFEVMCRGYNVVVLGASTSTPSLAAVCRMTGQRFNVTGPATVAGLVNELVQLIEGTDVRLWRRSVIERGWLAVARDHAGRDWEMMPPGQDQDGLYGSPAGTGTGRMGGLV